MMRLVKRLIRLVKSLVKRLIRLVKSLVKRLIRLVKRLIRVESHETDEYVKETRKRLMRLAKRLIDETGEEMDETCEEMDETGEEELFLCRCWSPGSTQSCLPFCCPSHPTRHCYGDTSPLTLWASSA